MLFFLCFRADNEISKVGSLLTLFSNPVPTPPFGLDLSIIIFVVISAPLINVGKNCAKFVHAHSRKPHPNTLRKLRRCTPAQVSHNLCTFLDALAHLSQNFSGTCRDYPAHKFGAAFSGTFGGVPTTPDPNTSAKVSRYNWDAYCDTNWRCIDYFLPTEGHTVAKVSR